MKMISISIGEQLYEDVKRRGMQHRNIYIAGYNALLSQKDDKLREQEGIISSVEKKVFKLSSLLAQYVNENEQMKTELRILKAERGV